jgi:methionyl-tRNA formyltransferase
MCGCHEVGWHLWPRLSREGIRLAALVTLTPEQARRFQVSGYRDLRPLAHEYGADVYTARTYSLRAEEDISFFEKNNFDVLVQGGWQRLFPEKILRTLKHGALGVHGSADFLPKGRGRSPLNWSLLEGKKRFIMQLFQIKPGIDDGDILDWEAFDINILDDIRSLYFKNVLVTSRMLGRSIPKILNADIFPHPQMGIPTYYPKRNPQDGLIDWEEMDVWKIYDFVRAQTRPYPGAYGRLQSKTYRIWRCRVFDSKLTYPDAGYGEIVEHFDDVFVVNCRGGLLLVEDYTEICGEAT